VGRRLLAQVTPSCVSLGVRKHSIGVQTFWFQAVCMNHIVWDAVEVVEFTRKHTGNVGDSLNEIRRIIEALAEKRDERKDGFAKAIAKATNDVIVLRLDSANSVAGYSFEGLITN
jgi:hypothetical protein